MKPALMFWFSISFTAYAQVVDVNGDDTVGAEEALAVAEQWKGEAGAPNAHNHLGQVWNGDRNPLIIKGNFPDRRIFSNGKGLVLSFIPSGALILDNTASNRPELHLDGSLGIIGAMEFPSSSLIFHSNESVTAFLNRDETGNPGAFNVREAGGSLQFSVSQTGNTTIYGNLDVNGTLEHDKSTYRIDHPLDPESKFLVHSGVSSSEDLNVYSGTVVLDSAGQAWVELDSYVEALNKDFRYQLTCVGGFAPVYVAEEIRANRFKIGGGLPGLKVCWEVTGVRSDLYAKAHPTEVEIEKSAEETGRYLHPALFGQSELKGIGYDVFEESE